MSTSFRALSVALVACAALAIASTARADGMDVSLARLRIPNGPVTFTDGTMGNRCGDPTVALYCPDNVAWDALLQQLAVSIAPPVLAPAGSLGPGGFSMSYDAWITTIAPDRLFWQNGTEGRSGTTEGTNRFTSSPLYWHRISIRKAFPFGFQLGTNVGQLVGTSYFTAGLDIQWSILEGMRRWGWLPDIAVRGAVQILFGETEFDLTVPTVDVIISKGITVGNVGVLTPYIAGQVLFLLGDSELVDLTPGVDSHVVPMDSFNNAVFNQIRKTRVRGVVGIQARFGWFLVVGAFGFDLTGADLRKPDVVGDAPIRALPTQFTASFSVGAAF